MAEVLTTTIINSATSPAFANGKRFYTDSTVAANPVLYIARHFKFDKNSIKSIYKRAYKAPQMFKVTFDMAALLTASSTTKDSTTTINPNVARITLYVRLAQASQSSLYANDFVFKGKPFTFEFPIKSTDTATTLGDRVVQIAKKNQIFFYDHELLDISNAAGTLTISGTDCYQMIKEADLELYNESAKTYDCCATFGQFETSSYGTVVQQGDEGFGSYDVMIHNYRLPTGANLRFAGINKDETPGIDKKYSQYTIRVCTDRGVVPGMVAGSTASAITEHTFFVDADVTTAWETALATIGTIETIDKDLDDVTVEDSVLEASVGNATKVKAAETTAHGTKN